MRLYNVIVVLDHGISWRAVVIILPEVIVQNWNRRVTLLWFMMKHVVKVLWWHESLSSSFTRFSWSLLTNRDHLLFFHLLHFVGAYSFLIGWYILWSIEIIDVGLVHAVIYLLGGIKWLTFSAEFVDLVRYFGKRCLSWTAFVITFGLAHDASNVAQNIVLSDCWAEGLSRCCTTWIIVSIDCLESSWLRKHSTVRRSRHLFALRILWDIIWLETVMGMFCCYAVRQIFWGHWRQVQSRMLLFQDHGVHPINWSISIAVWKKLFTFDSGRHNIANQRVFLGQISCKVHFLPLETLANAQARKTKVAADCGAFDEIKETI